MQINPDSAAIMPRVSKRTNKDVTESMTEYTAATDPVAPPLAKVPRKRGPKTEVNNIKRIADLQANEFAVNITPKSVMCKACGTNIKLDKRRTYYQTAWKRHCKRCTPQEQILLERAQVIAIQLSVWV
jgi:hydrogenase maturation factor HypF (carbamoyltransferase family)